MSDTDSLDYLQSGFEPSSLTMPRLRSILVSHDIEYPSNAKKAQLVEIFTDKVLPQSKKILNARERARRTSKGITNASDEEEEQMPPPPTPKARVSAGRKTKTPSRASSRTLQVEESEEDTIPVVARSPTKRASSKHAKVSDTESAVGIVKSVRKSRKSAPNPAPEPEPEPKPEPKIKSEEVDRPKDNRRDSNFTYDNPFQSGSSPPPSSERKRKSLVTPAAKDRRRVTSTTRRKTETPQEDEFHPPTSATFEVPVSALNGLTSVDDNGVEAGEAFTPEAQLELVRERSQKGVSALGPLRPRPAARRGVSAKGPLWIAAITVLGAYAGWYRQEQIAVGYCGVGREATAVWPANTEVPDWLRVLAEPQCEPCPPHAYCSENMQTVCETDFVLKPHPFSVFGVVPLAPTCEPDGEKVRRVKAVADKAVEELRERRAKFECGELVDEKGVPEPMVEIDAEQLKKEVSKKRSKRMAEAEFEELWAGAMGEIQGRDEVVSVGDRANLRILLTSTSLARVPLSCALRRSVRNTVAAYRVTLSFLAIFFSLATYLRQQLISRAKMSAQVPQLVSLTLDRLATQAALHAEDREIERYISIGQLRDDVLRDEHSISKREKLWQRVRQIVEMNANVRSSQREDRNGEVSRVWEWIGAVGEIEGRKRKSGRVSWYSGEGEMSSPVSGSDAGPELVQGKWAEGRPIY